MKFSAIAAVSLFAGSACAFSLFAGSTAALKKARAEPLTSMASAGAALNSKNFTAITATFKVPTPTVDGFGHSYIQIDTSENGCTRFRTGITWLKSGLNISYLGWYDTPDYRPFNLTIHAGDYIKATFETISATKGMATLQNLNGSARVSENWTTDESKKVCGLIAAWILEDSGAQDVGVVPFAGIGSFTFQNASAHRTNDSVDIDKATLFNLARQNTINTNEILTNVSISRPGTLSIDINKNDAPTAS